MTSNNIIRKGFDYTQPLPEGATQYIVAVRGYLRKEATPRKNGISYIWTDGGDVLYGYTRGEATRLTRAEAIHERDEANAFFEEMGYDATARIVKL